MAKRGVTQELIEEIRALPETKMLQDIQRVHAQGGDLEFRDPDGATPVSKSIKIEWGPLDQIFLHEASISIKSSLIF